MKFDPINEVFFSETNEETRIVSLTTSQFTTESRTLVLCFKGDQVVWRCGGHQFVLFDRPFIRRLIGNGAAINLWCPERAIRC